jgi:hypothetical protein
MSVFGHFSQKTREMGTPGILYGRNIFSHASSSLSHFFRLIDFLLQKLALFASGRVIWSA